jgi:uncharacterized repeat protein (TIGR01451 family)
MKRRIGRKTGKWSALLVVMGATLLLAGVLAPGAQARTEAFQALTPSSVELTAVTTDPASGLIYAQENSGTAFFVYNPKTNAWTELAPAPISSGNNGGAAFLNGKVYTVYTGNALEMGVYDIASNSWTVIDNPLEEGTGNITAGNGKLYLAVSNEFLALDPVTGIATPLAEPPKWPAAECGDGFEKWGALVFDGSKIYGHQGDGCTGFGVYDIATNTWTELPYVPEVEEEGAILGAAIDPVTNTYITYGPYNGRTLYRYDIEAGSWSMGTLPFTEVDDGGMAYVSLPGLEGVYMIQGEVGTEFTRYTEQNITDLSVKMSAKVAKTKTGGKITYSLQVVNNGPERAGGVVLSDSLPKGTKLLSATTSQGTCAGTPTLICNLGVLRSGTIATLKVKVKVGFGKFTNTATVSSQALDTNHANDSAKKVSKVVACVVPKLKGLSLKKAKKKLRKAHCRPGKVSHRFSGKVDAGKVIRGGKHRGAHLPAGSKVKLTVSGGPKPAKAQH